MHFTNVKMTCQNIYSEQEMWKKHFPVLPVAVCSGVACAPVLCTACDWCAVLHSQKDLPSSRVQILKLLIFISFQNIFVPWYGWHLALTARCSFCFILDFGELSFSLLVLCHKSSQQTCRYQNHGWHKELLLLCLFTNPPKILANLDKIPASVVLMSFSTNVPYKRLLDV